MQTQIVARVETTETVQVGLDGAEDSASSKLFQDPEALRLAPCTRAVGVDFVPDDERDRPPETVLRLCRECPVAVECLDYAIATGSCGYWAGTATAEREMLRECQVTGDQALSIVELMRQLADLPEASQAAIRQHEPGQGSLYRYRMGCHCRECRAAAAAVRKLRRANAAAKKALVA